ncbi:MAG: efflux RND transporter periplasmic adaptor subunit [Halothiobacillaceae bacterium]|jgi:multidrug efflux system membrane fusion protein
MITPARKALALLLLSTLTACKEPEAPREVIRPAQVWTVSEQAAAAATAYSGTVQARHEAALGFRIPGKISERRVELGSHVQAGQALAKLDTRDLDLQLTSSRAGLVAAEAELTQARNELARLKPLYEQKFIGKSVLDQAQAAFEAATARVSAARAQVSLAENQAQYTQLLADRPGIITRVAAEVGQVVAAGQPVFTVAYDGEREVHVRVGEATAQAMPVGTPLQVRLGSAPEPLRDGQVREIAPALDATRSVLVKVALPGAPQDLRLGLTAEVLLPAARGEATHWLPASALFQQGTSTAVWVLDPNERVTLHAIEVLAYGEDGLLVRGLTEGARVVAAGVHRLSEGQTVRPVPYDGPFKGRGL